MVIKTPKLNYRQNNNHGHLELIINATGVGVWNLNHPAKEIIWSDSMFSRELAEWWG